MLSGWQIPVGILASEGLFHRLIPFLGGRDGLKGFVSRIFPKLKPVHLHWMLVIALLFAVLPTNVYLLIWRVRDVLRVEHTHYLYSDELDALEWLEKNTQPSDIVFSGLTVGQYVPGIAGNKVYLGHWAQTADFYTKRARVAAFFRKDTSEGDRLAILKEFNVSYVLYGREERALGDLDPSRLPYLTLVHETSNTKIYRAAFDN
jgi:uncharacterized membrane protein